MKIKLLYFVNVDWFFISHRLDIALKALDKGYEVHIVTTLTKHKKELEDYGFKVHSVNISRGSGNIFSSIKVFLKFFLLLKKERPDLLHLVTIKPVLLGGIAARLANIQRVVSSISGMGYLYTNYGLINSLYRKGVSVLYRYALGHSHLEVIFQNPSDLELVSSFSKIDKKRTHLIKGSGVNLVNFSFSPLPEGRPIVLLASRMLIDKGVREFVQAARILRLNKTKARFVLVGEPDIENNASLSIEEIREWEKNKDIEYWGHSNNMSQTLKQSSIVVLPSYREGMPKVLLEAAAIGRPVVTTDVPGCRDSITEGITGILVPLRSVKELAKAIKDLLIDRELCINMGAQGRKLAEENFDITLVVKQHINIYEGLLESINK